MSEETSAAIADDTKLVAGIIREAMSPQTGEDYKFLSDVRVLQDFRYWAHGVRLALQAGRAAASSDLDAIKREAAREALTRLADSSDDGSMRGRHVAADAFTFRDREYPALVPEPPHVMVNGWRVTYHKDRHQKFCAERAGFTHWYWSAAEVCAAKSTHDEADTDVVRVLALREGRGDDADAK